MSSEVLRPRTIQQKYSILLTAIKANTFCKDQRQQLSLLRATPVGKYIQPQIAKDSAIKLINCFNRIHTLEQDQESKKIAIQCLKSQKNCQDKIESYVNFK